MKTIAFNLPIDQARQVNKIVAVNVENENEVVQLQLKKTAGLEDGQEGNRDIYAFLTNEIVSKEGSVWEIRLSIDNNIIATKIIEIPKVSIADINSSEILLYVKRLLFLTEGNVQEGKRGDSLNPSIAVFDYNNRKVQEIVVKGNDRKSYMQMAIDRTDRIPKELQISIVGAEGQQSQTDVCIESAPLIENQQ